MLVHYHIVFFCFNILRQQYYTFLYCSQQLLLFQLCNSIFISLFFLLRFFTFIHGLFSLLLSLFSYRSFQLLKAIVRRKGKLILFASIAIYSWKSDNNRDIKKIKKFKIGQHLELFCILGAPIIFLPTLYEFTLVKFA